MSGRTRVAANADPLPATNADAVVVLGAAPSEPGVPGPALRRRLVHGVAAWRRHRAADLVVSGGIVGPPPAEAEIMRALARELGVPAARIVVEDRARNTFENALYTGRIARERGWRRLIVVTDGYHMPRALYVFRRLGLPAEGDPVPERSGLSRFEWARALLQERRLLIQSAWLFLIGRHKPIVAAVWRD